MTTVVEALMQATQDIRDAIATVLGLRGEMQTLKDSTTAGTTTIINNFLTRPASTAFFIDAVNGSDSNDGATMATPLKNLDTAIGMLPRDGFSTIYMLSDCALNKYYNIYSPITFFGIDRAGASFVPFLRRLTFASEAFNSPVPTVGRIVAGFNVVASYLRFQYVDTMVGNPVAALDTKSHLLLQGATIQMSQCAINAPTSASLASLMLANDGAQSHLWFTGAIGASAPGHIVSGKAAGANPNTSYLFETNLATV